VQLTLFRKSLLLVLLPIAFNLLFFSYLGRLVKEVDLKAERGLANQKLILKAQEVRSATQTAGLETLRFCIYQNDDSKTKQLVAIEEAIKGLSELHQLCRDDPDKVRALNELSHRAYGDYGNERLLITLVPAANRSDFFSHYNAKWKVLLGRYERDAFWRNQMFDFFTRDAPAEKDTYSFDLLRTYWKTQSLLLIALSGSFLLTVWLTAYFNRNIRMRLQNIRENIARLVGTQPLLPPLEGTDEIALLDSWVHKTATLLKQLTATKRALVSSIGEKLAEPLKQTKRVVERVRKSGSFSARALENLDAAERSLNRLIRMVNDLILDENLEQTGMPLNMAKTSIDSVLQHSLQAVSNASDQKIKIDVQRAEVFVWGDEDRLVQVVANLLGNAVKFSPEQSIILVQVNQTEDSVSISVIDHGTGIPENFQNQLFERFAQASTGPQEGKGFGLGLSIAKRIVDEHGGRIAFKSKPHQGTTVTVTLPKVKLTASENDDIQPVKDGLTEPVATYSSAPRARAGRFKPDHLSAALEWLATRTTLGQKGLILVGTPLAFQFLAVSTLSILLWHSYEQLKATAHARQMASHCAAIICSMNDMTDATVLEAMGHHATSSNRCEEDKGHIQNELAKLTMTAGSVERPLVTRLEKFANEAMAWKLEPKNNVRAISTGAADDLQGLITLTVLIDRENTALSQLCDYEKRFEANDLIALSDAKVLIQSALVGAFVANILIALSLVFFFRWSIKSRLLHIIANSKKLVMRLPLSEPITGTDEIADIDISLIQTAEILFGLEKFKEELLYTASHDLRTPLCAVQCTLALITEGLLGPVPTDLLAEVAATETQSAQLIDFVNDLLAAGKSESANRLPH